MLWEGLKINLCMRLLEYGSHARAHVYTHKHTMSYVYVCGGQGTTCERGELVPREAYYGCDSEVCDPPTPTKC